MDPFEKYEVSFPNVVQEGKMYTCEEVKWYNFKEGDRYLMWNQGTYRIGTFEHFKWVDMYKQWLSVFTYVRDSDNRYCQEVSISGALPYIYYKLNVGGTPTTP